MQLCFPQSLYQVHELGDKHHPWRMHFSNHSDTYSDWAASGAVPSVHIEILGLSRQSLLPGTMAGKGIVRF